MTPDQKQIICDALDEPSNLTDWEYDFINDLAEFPDEYILYKKQNDILERIKEKL